MPPAATVKPYPALQPNATLPELTYDEMQHRQPLARLSLLGANWGSSRKRVGSWAGHVGLGSHLYFLVESLDHRMREDVLSKGLSWVQQKAGDPAIIYRTSTFEMVQQRYHMWPGSSGATHSVTVQTASLEWVRPTAAVAALNVACMHVNNLVAREKPDKTRKDLAEARALLEAENVLIVYVDANQATFSRQREQSALQDVFKQPGWSWNEEMEPLWGRPRALINSYGMCTGFLLHAHEAQFHRSRARRLFSGIIAVGTQRLGHRMACSELLALDIGEST